MSLPQSLLECQDFACERDGRLLFSGLNLQINSGDIVQIEGPNGSGKTTFLRAITGLFTGYSGELKWQGESIEQVRLDFLSNLLYLGHLPGVRKSLTPRENLLYLCQLHGSSSITAIDQALEHVGLYGYEEMPGYQLSAGQHRRIGLARLYLTQAPLWILDEPFTAIDKEGVAKLEALFVEHAAKGGAVVMTTHQSPSIDQLKVVPLLDYVPRHAKSHLDAHSHLEEEGLSNE
jgi:heme exporter protein A